MEHPLIGDISALNIDDVTTKINELHKKLGIAQRSGNGHLCHQLRMAIESFQSRYHQLLQDQQKDTGRDFSGIINIE
jgi:hypothetical protein